MRFQEARLVPERDVSDLQASLAFYTQVIGFTIVFQRPEERFAYLDLDGANLMLEEAAGPGRRFRTAPAERPFGRGMNLQIAVSDIDTLHRRVLEAGSEMIIPMEERRYRVDDLSVGHRQFVVADPDGYLLRFFQDSGSRTSIDRGQ
jgi:catechol 2,3-dioxygenase-like lactoylglutathione lyase family enzyme